MTEVIALLTGATGFLGKKFLNLLQNMDINRYTDVITVGRGNRYNSIYTGETLYPSDLPKVEMHMFHFATLYNPKPRRFVEIEEILGSNIFFPVGIMKAVPGITRVYCMQSYQELLPISLQNEYSLSKSLFTTSLKSCGISIRKFYLFDNFGVEDKRGKVVDVFIERALAGVDIEIPNNKVLINLCEASNVVQNIFELIDAESDSYIIGNKETISLSDLAHFIVNKTKSRSKIILKGTSPDFLKYVQGDVTNLTGYNNVALYEGLSEHIFYKRTNSF